MDLHAFARAFLAYAAHVLEEDQVAMEFQRRSLERLRATGEIAGGLARPQHVDEFDVPIRRARRFGYREVVVVGDVAEYEPGKYAPAEPPRK